MLDIHYEVNFGGIDRNVHPQSDARSVVCCDF